MAIYQKDHNLLEQQYGNCVEKENARVRLLSRRRGGLSLPRRGQFSTIGAGRFRVATAAGADVPVVFRTRPGALAVVKCTFRTGGK